MNKQTMRARAFVRRVRETASAALSSARMQWQMSAPPSPCDTCTAPTMRNTFVVRGRVTRRCYACEHAAELVRMDRVYARIMNDIFSTEGE
jgi:hypothetical protein